MITRARRIGTWGRGWDGAAEERDLDGGGLRSSLQDEAAVPVVGRLCGTGGGVVAGRGGGDGWAMGGAMR